MYNDNNKRAVDVRNTVTGKSDIFSIRLNSIAPLNTTQTTQRLKTTNWYSLPSN